MEKKLIVDELRNVLNIDIPDHLGKAHILPWDEIREMRDPGISFGTNSLNDPNLIKLQLQQATINRSI